MILTRSPYYIDVDRSTAPTSYTLALFVWQGDKNTPPAEAAYSVTKTNPELLTTPDAINISDLVRDYIAYDAFDLIEGVNDYTNTVWIKTAVYLEDEVSPAQELTDFATTGYSFGKESRNLNPTKAILINGGEFKASDYLVIPVQGFGNVTYESKPDSNVNGSYNLLESDLSDEQIRLIKIDLSGIEDDKFIQVDYNGESLFFYPEQADKYTHYNIHFINKYGVMQALPFFKERKDNLEVKKETYKGQLGVGYHQYIDFNTNGRTDFSIKSGFIDEETNAAYKELMLSDRIWIYEEGSLIPINRKKPSLEYQTRLNDKLVQYTFDFEYSFDEINTY